MIRFYQRVWTLNPLLRECKSFRPEGHGEELMLFEQVGIDLVHGWIVDPNTDEAKVLSKPHAEDYDSAVVLIAEVDHLTKGQLVVHDTDIPQETQVEGAGSSKAPSKWTEEEREKIDD
ncbi:hypothetical protein MPER_02356, partial [Moniliophthora perniciosa FA553]